MRGTRVTLAGTLAGSTGLLLGLLAGGGTLCAIWSPAPAGSRNAHARRCTPADPCLALVVDDVGRDLSALKELLALQADLTFAVLPHAKHTRESLALLVERRREFIVHLPMDPLDRDRITDEPVVLGRDGPLAEATEACFREARGALGFNNHMGSALSQDRLALGQVLAVARARGMWVLDSKTTDRSVICDVAGRMGIRCLERDVFLDDGLSRDAIQGAWATAVKAAQRRGWAIVVGHPHPATIQALRALVPRSVPRIVRLSTFLAEE